MRLQAKVSQDNVTALAYNYHLGSGQSGQNLIDV